MSIYKQNVGTIPSRIGGVGRQVYIVAADHPVTVTVHGKNGSQQWSETIRLTAGLGVNYDDRTLYGDGIIAIEVSSDIEQQVTVWLSSAKITDNRTEGLRVSVLGSPIIASTSEVIGETAVRVAAINPARRKITFQVLGGEAAFGGKGVSFDSGLLVGDGSSIEFEVSAEIYAVSKDSVNVRIFEESN